MLSVRRVILLSSILCLLIFSSVGKAQTIKEELFEIDKLRAGFDTPFDEVEKRCNKLLQKYTKPEEQGKIYYELTKVEGQSGFQRPAKAIEYAKKALELPQDPWRTARLHGYWGSAIQVAHRGTHDKEMVKARREAVIPYLQGLRKLQQYNLPEVKPRIPMAGFITHDGPTDSEEYRKMKLKHEKEVAAQKLAKFQRSMIEHRDILTLQVSGMYSRFPWASDEIRELATKILKDEDAVERLMSAIDAAVQQRIRELGWEPELPDMNSVVVQVDPDMNSLMEQVDKDKGISGSKEFFIPTPSDQTADVLGNTSQTDDDGSASWIVCALILCTALAGGILYYVGMQRKKAERY